jgi:cellulose synthase/poly-beta-1,6-N-acetylglucosamine synthase-like glycosyltransferase
VSSAKFYDEKPDSLGNAIRQRVRWMVGHLNTCRLYSGPLLLNAYKTRSLRSLELALYYCYPIGILVSLLGVYVLLPGTLMNVVRVEAMETSMAAVLSILTLTYILGLPALGYFLENSPRSIKSLLKAGLYSVYAAVFALIVWPVSIVAAILCVWRKDWMFHTPHKSQLMRPLLSQRAQVEVAPQSPDMVYRERLGQELQRSATNG